MKQLHQLAEKRNFVSISIEDGLHHHFSIIRSAVSSDAQSWLSKTHQQDLDLTIQEFSSYQLKIKASKCCSSEIKVPSQCLKTKKMYHMRMLPCQNQWKIYKRQRVTTLIFWFCLHPNFVFKIQMRHFWDFQTRKNIVTMCHEEWKIKIIFSPKEWAKRTSEWKYYLYFELRVAHWHYFIG